MRYKVTNIVPCALGLYIGKRQMYKINHNLWQNVMKSIIESNQNLYVHKRA